MTVSILGDTKRLAAMNQGLEQIELNQIEAAQGTCIAIVCMEAE
jgi:hypothetical protein